MPDIETDETCSECGQPIRRRKLPGVPDSYRNAPGSKHRDKFVCYTTGPKCALPIRPA